MFTVLLLYPVMVNHYNLIVLYVNDTALDIIYICVLF